MKTIRDLFSKPIDRRIEEVIKVDQSDEATVLEELQEYVITESIGDHFTTVYKAIAEAPAEPHEGIGIWISGFFGSGKSSFAKIVGYTVGGRIVCGKSSSQMIKEKACLELPKPQADALVAYLDLIEARIPTYAIIFDVSMDRGVRTANERITEIMYKALLRALDYAEDFDLAELEISLEADGLLDDFRKSFEAMHGKRWEERRKLGRAINEASSVLNKLDPRTYPSADSWAKSLGQGRADITPNLLAERAFELAGRRRPGQALIFIIDEVGQYVSRSVDKMLDLQAVVQAFGREGKNRVNRKQAIAPCWIVVTSQEKLNEVVDALDSRKIELARLQDRFPYPIDLKQSDISEVTSKRVLQKRPEAITLLRTLFNQHEGRLKALCTLERTGRNTEITRENFINLYPYLPYQIDLCIDIVSGLRLRRGAQRHIGGSNRTIIKQAQQMLVHPQTNLASRPIGDLVTLDLVYELLYAGNLLPTEVTREVDDVPARLPNDQMAYKVAKAIALLEVVTDLPRTPRNLAAVLHPRIDADSVLSDVSRALKSLEEAQIVRESEEGFKLLTIQEKNWDTVRRGLHPRPADRNWIKRELLQEVFADPSVRGYRYQNRKAFPLSLTIDGELVDGSGQIPLALLMADDPADFDSACEEARRASNEKRSELFWVCALTDEVHRQIEELYRSREMVSTHERLAAQGKLSPEEGSCLADEKVRRDRIHRTLRNKLAERIVAGAGFFQGVRKDASALGQTVAEIYARFRDDVIPALYPKFDLGNRPVRGDEAEKFLVAANLNGLPPVFYEEPDGLNLVIRQSGKAIPNLNAEICREVLDYLKREHSYGNKVTGKSLDAHFQGIGYAWERDVLRIVLAVLLRGGAIEVTHQGRKYRNHNDPACRQPFINNNAFRAASFSPREALDLKMLTDAARYYEAMTGNEVDIEESALAQAFQKLAADDRELIMPLINRMKATQLPGVEHLVEFQETIEGILEMPADDCVKTLAGEGKSYQEARARARQLAAILTKQNTQLLRAARHVLDILCPVLEAREPSDEIIKAVAELRLALQSEWFDKALDSIQCTTNLLTSQYRKLYEGFHKERFGAYSAAIDEVKGLPEWALVADNPGINKARLNAILIPLENKACDQLELADYSDVCQICHANIAQMESEIAAVDALKLRAIRELQELAAPEKKIIRVRVSSVLGNVIETPEDIEEAMERLKEHLIKLLAEDARIILE
ncbi:MAG: BREX system P-loop protein BrxC [Armatimonadetes bacterium]|nr:BREX system P-loop protein BrxC [Armatimonadota bacterium]